MTPHTSHTRRLTRTLWWMTGLCLATSAGVVACSSAQQQTRRADGSCARNPLPLTQGIYVELASSPDASDGRAPRRTTTDWPWASHPHHTAPDMGMKLDRDGERVVLTYKREGETFAEHWTIGEAKQRERMVLKTPATP